MSDNKYRIIEEEISFCLDKRRKVLVGHNEAISRSQLSSNPNKPRRYFIDTAVPSD